MKKRTIGVIVETKGVIPIYDIVMVLLYSGGQTRDTTIFLGDSGTPDSVLKNG